MCPRMMRRIEVPRYPSHIIYGFRTTPSLVGDGPVPCVSEGPKVEEMEKVGKSQCYSPLHQDRELWSSSSPLLPSDIHLESFLIWSLRQDRVVKVEDDVRVPQSIGTDKTHFWALAKLRTRSNKSVLRSFPWLTSTFLGAKKASSSWK